VNDTPAELEDHSIWTRLRRRKVVQWSVAYVAAAWALLQGLEFLAGIYDWPTAFLRVVTLALALGVPIVVTLAWYHGDRGEQHLGGTELSIVAVLFLLGGGVVWYYQRTADTSTTARSAPTIEPLPTDASIAVLPFVNMSADKEQEYFADGISEELLNLLAQVPELRVIARTSSFSFKGKDVDIAEIARRLNVANVLEGSVRKSGDKLRITAQLVRASDSSHLWSQTYDRQMADVFEVQDEIAASVVASVVSELKIKLLGTAPPTSHVTDPQAYSLLLQARASFRQGTAEAVKRSITQFDQALAIDPGYAAAWADLANAYELEMTNGWRPIEEGNRLARQAIERTLALDPDYVAAHAFLGWILIAHDLDYKAAVEHTERAMALEPTNPDAIDTAAYVARRLGRHDLAIALYQYLVARDPLNYIHHSNLAYAYWYAGRIDDALNEHRLILALNPDLPGAHAAIGEALLLNGDARAALTEVEQETDEQLRLPVLAMTYHSLGRTADSDAALAELVRKYEGTSAFPIATVLAYRGEADRAFEWLDKAVRYHDTLVGTLAVYPSLASLHSDPRWLPFLRKLGMAPEQLAAIKFDVTVPR
jgi:TolB-like protein/tetratricopeptide (TPR) repeat protein